MTTTLWANGTIRVETGFLALFIAFVIKSEYAEASGFTQLLLLGVVGVAAGLGGFIGNGLGARLPLSKPETVSILSLAAVAVTTLVAVLAPGLTTAAIVGLVGSTASSLAKVCLDSVIQHELPEASRASAFGLSETVLQLSWVFGGVVGLLIGGVWSFGHDSVYVIGFAVITVLLILGLVQSWLVRSGRSLFPWLDYSKLSKHFRRADKGRPKGRRQARPVRPEDGHRGTPARRRRAATHDDAMDRTPGRAVGVAEPGPALATARVPRPGRVSSHLRDTSRLDTSRPLPTTRLPDHPPTNHRPDRPISRSTSLAINTPAPPARSAARPPAGP